MSPSVKDAVLIFLAVLVVYALTAGGHLYSPDEEIVFRMTESILEDGDLAIEPLQGFATRRGADGKQYAQYGVGQPLLALPFYALGRLAAPYFSDDAWRRLYGPSARGLTASQIAPRFACSFFNIFMSAFSVALLYLLIREIVDHRRASILAVALYGFGSIAWAHSRPFFTETAAVACILLAWYCAYRSLRGAMTRWMMAAGAAAGFAALVRMDSVLLYPGLTMILLGPVRKARAERQPRLHPYLAFCIPALACGGVLLGLNKLHFGGFFATGYSDQPEGVRFSTPILAGLYGLLFSAGKGVFFFSPALVLGLWGWREIQRRDRFLTAGLALSILLPLAVMAKWQNWTGGWCWGPRHIIMIHPFVAMPIAFWLGAGWNPARRAIACVLLTIGIGVQLLGCSQDFMQFHELFFRRSPRLQPDPYFRVLYDAYDETYWSEFFELRLRGSERKIPLGQLPAPIQNSIYLPQSSVWTGYPMMWRRYGALDNVWVRMARGW